MQLGAGLRRALARISGAAVVDEKAVRDMVKELQRALISNDVSVQLVADLSSRIERRALAEKPPAGANPREHVVKIVYDELAGLMGEKYTPDVKKKRVLLLGLFGAGKTTSAAKIAKFYKDRGLKTGLLACDTFRPAAYEQLSQLGTTLGVPFYGEKGAKDAAAVAAKGLAALKDCDVIIADSSGRSALDPDLIDELKRLTAAFRPDEKILVVAADLGQVAGKQAEQFNKAVGVTGVLVTKMDGSGRGGGALSSVHATGAKVAFIGVGEKLGDLEPFDAKKFVAGLLGFPDLPALLERIKTVAEEEKIEPEEMLEHFNFRTFQEQLRATKKMGPLSKVFGMMGMVDLPPEMMAQSETKLKKYDAMIGSMTKAEREKPELLKERKRIERIAKGAGAKPEDVREMIKQFEQMAKLFKQFKSNKGMRKKLEQMMASGKMPRIGG